MEVDDVPEAAQMELVELECSAAITELIKTYIVTNYLTHDCYTLLYCMVAVLSTIIH